MIAGEGVFWAQKVSVCACEFTKASPGDLNDSAYECYYAQSSAVAGMPGKDRTGDRWNLEEQIDVHKHQKDQQWQLCDERDWFDRNQAHVEELIKMTQNAEHGGGNHFVKVEADKSAQPAPEQKTQLFDEKKRNEQGSE